jgi:hypothetical protein
MDYSAIEEIPFERAIEGPLLACNEAQSRIMAGTFDQLRTFFWQENKKGSGQYSPVQDGFYFLQEKAGQRVLIPRMTLLPVPTMLLDDLSVTFQARLTSITKDKMTVKMLGERTESAGSEELHSYLNVRLHAGVSDMPMGLARFYQICSDLLTSFTCEEE